MYQDLRAKRGAIGKEIVGGIMARFDTGFRGRLSGGFFVGFNLGSSGGLRIEDRQSDGGIDAGFNSGFDNGFFGGSDERFDGRRRFDGIRLEMFRLGFG